MSKQRFLGGLLGANPLRDGSFTDPTIAPGYDLSAAPTTLTDVTWSISTSAIHSFGFSSDGLNMYASDYANSRILFQPLATAYDPGDTAAGNSVHTVPGGSDAPQMGLTVSPDGTKAVWDKGGNGNVGYCTFSTGWDASTGGTNNNYNMGVTNRGYSLDDTGTVAVFNNGNGTAYRHTLSTPWDPSTGTLQESLDMVSTLGFSSGFWFRNLQWINDGNSFLVMQHSDGVVRRVDVTTPYTFTGATANGTFDFKTNGAAYPRAFRWGGDDLLIYDYNNGSSDDNFRKTSLPAVSIISTDRTTSNVGILSLDEAGPEDGPSSGTAVGTWWTLETPLNSQWSRDGDYEASRTGGFGGHGICVDTEVTSGKYYAEFWWDISQGGTDSGQKGVGVATNTASGMDDTLGTHTTHVWIHYASNGKHYPANSAWGSTMSNGDVVGLAVDYDNGKVWTHVNGTWSSTGGDPSSGGAGHTWTTHLTEHPSTPARIAFGSNGTQGSVQFNGGDNGTFGGNVTAGGNTDTNGLGDFKYSVPTGFQGLYDAVPGSSRELPQINWGGIRGRDAVVGTDPDFNLVNTGILSLNEALMHTYGLPGPFGFTFITAETTLFASNTTDYGVAPPSAAQSGDLLIVTSWVDNPSGSFIAGHNNHGGNEEIVDTIDGTEYPEGQTWFYIHDGTTNLVGASTHNHGSDTGVTQVLVFRPSKPIAKSTVTVVDTGRQDGIHALSATVTSGGVGVPTDGARIWCAVATGRPEGSALQPVAWNTVTWTTDKVDATTTTAAHAYLIEDATGIPFTSTTTTDVGRQSLHSFLLDIEPV